MVSRKRPPLPPVDEVAISGEGLNTSTAFRLHAQRVGAAAAARNLKKGLAALQQSILRTLSQVKLEEVVLRDVKVWGDELRVQNVRDLYVAIGSDNPKMFNEAIDRLQYCGMVYAERGEAVEPLEFSYVGLTGLGEFYAQRGGSPRLTPSREFRRDFFPVGSPFGMTADHWREIESVRRDPQELYACLGYQWKSSYYNSTNLELNVKGTLLQAVQAAKCADDVGVEFRPLRAGYGGHVLNDIVADIISSDIAFFDASDRNPNVMLETGVALTWGIPVVLVRHESSPLPPSDLAGLTWAAYANDASEWNDPELYETLARTVSRALLRKKSG